MAVVSIPDEQRTINDAPSMSAFLGQYGITYEQWKSARSVPAGASAEAVLQAYADKIDELKSRGGYTTADVIDVTASDAEPRRDAREVQPRTLARRRRSPVHRRRPGHLSHRSARRARCSRSKSKRAISSACRAGRIHWFDLCADRRIRAIRLFQDVSGWTPHYTDSGVDANFQPVCFGPALHQGARPDRRRERQPFGASDPRGRSRHRGDDHARRLRLPRCCFRTLAPMSAAFLSREWDSAACREAVALLGRERAADAAAGRLNVISAGLQSCRRGRVRPLADGSRQQVARSQGASRVDLAGLATAVESFAARSILTCRSRSSDGARAAGMFTSTRRAACSPSNYCSDPPKPVISRVSFMATSTPRSVRSSPSRAMRSSSSGSMPRRQRRCLCPMSLANSTRHARPVCTPHSACAAQQRRLSARTR